MRWASQHQCDSDCHVLVAEIVAILSKEPQRRVSQAMPVCPRCSIRRNRPHV